MKKALTALLARMARDGEIETVAEIIEEMIAGKEEVPAEEPAEAAAPAAGTAETAEAGEPVTVEVPENREITIDENGLTGILERLDRLIALLAPPEPAACDGDLAESVAETVGEVLEAVQTAEEETSRDPAAEVSEIVESILEPVVSTTIEEAGEDA